jgi:hypothetical protein
LPGDVTNRMFGNPDIPPEAIEQAKERLGLNDPSWCNTPAGGATSHSDWECRSPNTPSR